MTKQSAACLLIGLMLCTSLFHVLVLFRLIPYTVVWAGKLHSPEEMYVFESIALGINTLIIFTVVQHMAYSRRILSPKLTRWALWAFVLLFLLNTLGNLFAENIYEQVLGTAFTLLSAYLCFILARNKK